MTAVEEFKLSLKASYLAPNYVSFLLSAYLR